MIELNNKRLIGDLWRISFEGLILHSFKDIHAGVGASTVIGLIFSSCNFTSQYHINLWLNLMVTRIILYNVTMLVRFILT